MENWPAEDYWLKVLCIERSQVVANVNIGGSELIIDDSKQASDSNVSVPFLLSFFLYLFRSFFHIIYFSFCLIL